MIDSVYGKKLPFGIEVHATLPCAVVLPAARRWHRGKWFTSLREACARRLVTRSRWCFFAVACCLALAITSEGFAAPSGPVRSKPVAELMNADGTLNLTTGYSGGIDLTGFRVVMDPDEAPRIVSTPIAGSTASEATISQRSIADDRWDSRFTGPAGVFPCDVRALAAIGTDLYVGGTFSSAGGIPANRIAKWDGTTWSALGTGIGGPPDVYVEEVSTLVAIGTDLYVGGYFHTAGGVAANNTAKWDGTAWSALGTGIAGGTYNIPASVSSLVALGTDLYAAGNFSTAGGVAAKNVAKWDGTTWSALGTGVEGGGISSLAVIGTDLYASGSFTTAGGIVANEIAKWDGTTWSALGTGVAGGGVSSLAVIGTDLYAGGSFATAGGIVANGIAKWDGTSWSALGDGLGYGDVYALAAIGSDLYVGGSFSTAGGITANDIAKWDGAGWAALGADLGSEYGQTVYALTAIGTDLYIGGNFTNVGGVAVGGVAKWTGTSVSSLGGATGKRVNGAILGSTAIGTDLYVGGVFTSAGDVTAIGIAKWNGIAWTALGTGIRGQYYQKVTSLAAIGTDLYVGGLFTSIDGIAVENIAKWDGTSWSSLGGGVSGEVSSLAVIGTDLYVGGSFSYAGGIPASNIARWDGEGWSPLGAGANHAIFALAVMGTNLYAGGQFTSAGEVAAENIARWDGTTWSALGTGITSGLGAWKSVHSLAVIGQDLYVGGAFYSAGGNAANSIAKWDGTAWSALGTGLTGSLDFGSMLTSVFSLVAIGTDLYAGGNFITAGGGAASGIAKWDGTSWSALGAGTDDRVYTLTAIGTALYAGGMFTTAGGKESQHIGLYYTGNCGNGFVDDGEGCDPLAPGAGLCCNATTCQFAIAGVTCRPSTGPCDVADTCDGLHATCVDGLASAGTVCHVNGCASYQVCSGTTPGCGQVNIPGPLPADSCLVALKTQFQIRTNADPSKNQVKWSWASGEAFDGSKLGTPNVNTQYSLCVYDAAGSVPSLALELGAAAGPLWRPKAALGWSYADKLGSLDGVQKLVLKAGAALKTKAQVGARGLGLPALTPSNGNRFFNQDPSVVVQLVHSEGLCLTSEFTNAVVNDGSRFQARTP